MIEIVVFSVVQNYDTEWFSYSAVQWYHGEGGCTISYSRPEGRITLFGFLLILTSGEEGNKSMEWGGPLWELRIYGPSPVLLCIYVCLSICLYIIYIYNMYVYNHNLSQKKKGC